ncbi:MAG: nucleotidyltransferase family protein [Negativicutes bacterium]|nr:nucleotidyltransferase family protein [Negativicutes bacterium]
MRHAKSRPLPRAAGIIAEYNPFHNGHAFHLRTARSIAGTPLSIAVLSGNFTQRGTPAIADKWQRAAVAVRNGVDLVLELPHCFATQSAEGFASGAIRLLAATGLVDRVVCGSETGDLTAITAAALALSQEGVQQKIRHHLSSGKSYAASVAAALAPAIRLSPLTPNDILAVEYARAIDRHQAGCKLLTIRRRGSRHNQLQAGGEFASAGAIRLQLRENPHSYLASGAAGLPPITGQWLHRLLDEGLLVLDRQFYDRLVLSRLRLLSPGQLAGLSGISEGLENKLCRLGRSAGDCRQLLAACKSKRFHTGRLSRCLLNCLFGLSREQVELFNQAGPGYIRPLAFNRQGQGLLSVMRRTASLPIVTRPAPALRSQLLSETGRQQLLLDTLSSDIFGLLTPSVQIGGRDYRQPPLLIVQ